MGCGATGHFVSVNFSTLSMKVLKLTNYSRIVHRKTDFGGYGNNRKEKGNKVIPNGRFPHLLKGRHRRRQTSARPQPDKDRRKTKETLNKSSAAGQRMFFAIHAE